MRARGAVLSALRALGDAHRAHDDCHLGIRELAGAVRRWIGGQTFSAREGSTGIALLDAPTAPYADVDELRIVGLIDPDWPARGERSIFYPASLLGQLGWPSDVDSASARPARASRISSGCRGGASPCRRSRSKTTPSCRPRRCSTTWTPSACRSRRRLRLPPDGCSRTRPLRWSRSLPRR